uniref:Uncharacterized protein n=1 Tax=Timema tahoe TaxID=61484 RepID=A0A7R9IQ99_9NEOP|nr:unnamed protein product [Timema tahoe]
MYDMLINIQIMYLCSIFVCVIKGGVQMLTSIKCPSLYKINVPLKL